MAAQKTSTFINSFLPFAFNKQNGCPYVSELGFPGLASVAAATLNAQALATLPATEVLFMPGLAIRLLMENVSEDHLITSCTAGS